MTIRHLNWSYDEGMWRETETVCSFTKTVDVPDDLWESYQRLEVELREIGDLITALCDGTERAR